MIMSQKGFKFQFLFHNYFPTDLNLYLYFLHLTVFNLL
jgi:hypothetical protein